jgi:hypothetical protein
MSGGPAASLPPSVEELRALVVELWEANAGLREVIAAQDHQIVAVERRIAELERRLGEDSSTSSRPGAWCARGEGSWQYRLLHQHRPEVDT